jgi:AcrR family transcriptional regulator
LNPPVPGQYENPKEDFRMGRRYPGRVMIWCQVRAIHGGNADNRCGLDNVSYVCIIMPMRAKIQSKSAEDQATVTRLLDTAERLFGELGYDGVGMRMLADEAKVNLGAATYHYGSKEALYIETFMRGFRPVNAERQRLLRDAETQAGGKPVPVEKIVEFMVRPPFESGLEHPAFHKFLARNLLMPPPFIHAAIEKELAPSIEVFIAALKRALPDIPEDLLHLRSMFAMGALLMFSIHASEMPGMKSAKSREAVLCEMIGYVTAGLKSSPAVPSSERPRLPVPPKHPKR